MVATICRWDDQAKLVNLVMRLRGQAYAFFRSCTPQDLHSLFYRAYPRAQQGSLEAVGMGQSVLANQFVSGLHAAIKAKVAGSKGSFDQLLTKARFEEAKLRDLTGHGSQSSVPPSPRPVSNPTQPQQLQQKQGGGKDFRSASKNNQGNLPRCYSCGSTAHLAKQCPSHKGSGPVETPGRGRGPGGGGQIASITSNHEATKEPKPETVAELRQRLQEAEAKEAVGEVAATMHAWCHPWRNEGCSTVGANSHC